MHLVVAFAMSLASAAWIGPPAGAETVPTPVIKAVYLVNFARFTEWPAAAPQGPLTLCVLGDADVAASLDNLIGDRPINGRAVSVASLATFRIVHTCHLLYIAGEDPARTASALGAVASLHVLTVGDGEPFVRGGGIAALLMKEGLAKFAVNPDALSRSGLRISSKMLSLARLVREEPR
jgi:hypothetical protein